MNRQDLSGFSAIQWTPLMTGIAIGLAIILGWTQQPADGWWQNLDNAWFFFANGSLAEGETWQVFWALCNNRLFDLIPAVMILSLYGFFVLKAPNETRKLAIAFGVFIALYTVATAQIAHLMFDFDRDSPTVVLEPAYLLSELVPWSNPKDQSGTSFPGDHAMVLLIVSGFITAIAGWRYGVLGLVITVLGSMPRLVGGAHWLTDIAVGSVGISVIALSVALFTPLAVKTVQFIKRYTDPFCQRLL